MCVRLTDVAVAQVVAQLGLDDEDVEPYAIAEDDESGDESLSD